MKEKNKLEIEFLSLIKKLKENKIDINEALDIFRKLIDQFECSNDKEIKSLNELKNEFERLTLQIKRIKNIDSNINQLEYEIENYKLKLLGSRKLS